LVGLALDARQVSAFVVNVFALLAGGLLGWWFFGSLRWLSARMVGGDGVRWGWLLLLQALRVALLGWAAFIAARQGAPALLAFMVGVLAARHGLVARARREHRSVS
jgi:hypothetical protein